MNHSTRPSGLINHQAYCWILALLAATSLCEAQDIPTEIPSGNGQLETAPKLIPGGVDELGREYSYLGQPSENQKIIFTASNGFFTKGTCTAVGESKLPKVGDEELIVPNFGWLEKWKDTEGTLRWYVHAAKAGKLRLQTLLEVSAEEAGAEIEIRFGDYLKTATTAKSDGKKPQNWDLVFDVPGPGEYQISLKATSIPSPGSGVGKLHRLEAFGPALDDAHLLRVRWRPAAVHGGYESVKAGDTSLLVMTTRSTEPISSYSPVTTPFGYYGTSFTAEKRSNGEFNFSMWGQDGAMSDLKLMPHLLGVGSPEGEFSGFGHEGTGVKARGWTPMPDGPELCVQALRVERGELYDSYYGYFFDHPTKAWKFYCAGNKWHGGKSKPELKIGSFCEVPGPPQNERTGDVYREVRRRGWYHDGGKWTPMETFNIGGSGSKGEIPVSKSWFTSADGEFAMGCGGIRLYQATQPAAPTPQSELPYFLKSDSIANLFAMPIEFGDINVTVISPTDATIDIPVSKGEALSTGAIYYGTVDALTFAPRDLHGTEKKSELSQSVLENAWQEMHEIDTVSEGSNRIKIDGLSPDTTYFFRVLANNDVSRVWNSETLTFTTLKSGAQPAESEPTGPSLTDEPIRIWTYSVNGQDREIEGRLTGISETKIEIERKADGKKGSLDLNLFSADDQAYVSSKR